MPNHSIRPLQASVPGFPPSPSHSRSRGFHRACIWSDTRSCLSSGVPRVPGCCSSCLDAYVCSCSTPPTPPPSPFGRGLSHGPGSESSGAFASGNSLVLPSPSSSPPAFPSGVVDSSGSSPAHPLDVSLARDLLASLLPLPEGVPLSAARLCPLITVALPS